MNVLVVEDEPLIADVVARALEREGIRVTVRGDGETALVSLVAERFDLVVLDLMLPGRDGLEICRELRHSDQRTPVIMLTARDALEDKVLGLDSGADDYVTKPFELPELLARVRSLMRRAQPAPAARLEAAGVVIDGENHAALFHGHPLPLTDTEWRLLEYLMRRADTVCRRRELLEQVWGYDFDPGSNVVDVFVRRLRHKLDAAGVSPVIETVRGMGYRFRP